MKFFEDVKIPQDYVLVNSPRKLSYLTQELNSVEKFSFDIETTHPTVRSKEKIREYLKVTPIYVAGVSFSWGRTCVERPWKPGKAAYVPLRNRDDTPYWKGRQEPVINALKQVLENPVPKIAHNGKFDVRELAKKEGILTNNLKFDTMLAHAILDEDRRTSTHKLKSEFKGENEIHKGCANVYLDLEGTGFKGDLEEALTHFDPVWRRYSKVPLDILYPYACADADFTLSLVFPFIELMAREGLLDLFQSLVMPLQHAIMLLELHGAPLHIPKARQVEAEQLKIMDELTLKIHELAGSEFNVSSTDKLGQVLFVDLQLPGGKKSEYNKWIVNAETLRSTDHPIVEPVLQYRRAQQIQSTYATAALHLVEEVTHDGTIGWVHPTYWLDSATGRLKCHDPNLTNLPRPENGGDIVKSMWVCAPFYKILFKDFSQIELRVIAHESEEPVWVEGFQAGLDMHSAMAHRVFHLDCPVEEVKDKYKDKRSQAKAVNFGIAFGESEWSLAQNLGITYEEAKHLIHVEYFGTAPVLKAWIDEVHLKAETDGWVANMFGRRRHLPDAQLVVPMSVPWPHKSERKKCYRKCVAPYQLGIDLQDLHTISSTQIKQLINLKKQTNFFKCCECKALSSCFINSEVKYQESKKARAMRQAVNFIIQGGAADMCSMCFIWITEEMRKQGVRSRPILYIHDEIGCYTHVDDIEKADRIMEYCMTTKIKEYTQFKVPILTDTEIVQCWGDKK